MSWMFELRDDYEIIMFIIYSIVAVKVLSYISVGLCFYFNGHIDE